MNIQKSGQYPKHQTRLFYGYIIVALGFFIQVMSWGPYGSFGVLFNPLIDDFGWTRAATSAAFSLSMIIFGVLSIVMGGLTDRFGPRIVVTCCGILFGLGYLSMSQINNIWQLYLLYGLVIGVGLSGTRIPQLSTVARWFVKRRGLMTGLVLTGGGIGQLVMSMVLSRLIAAYDWRLSLIFVGSVILISVVLAAQFLKRDPTQIGQLPYGGNEDKGLGLESATIDLHFKEAIGTTQFWLAWPLFFCCGYGPVSTVVHIVPHALELGISPTSAANILAIMGGMSIIGNSLMGGVVDRIGSRLVFAICFFALAAAFFWLTTAREIWMLYIFAVVASIAIGGMAVSESPLIAKLFGLSSHGLIYGSIHLGFTVGAAVGPIITGYIFDLTGTYQEAFLVCSAVCMVGFILAAALRPIKRARNLNPSLDK